MLQQRVRMLLNFRPCSRNRLDLHALSAVFSNGSVATWFCCVCVCFVEWSKRAQPEFPMSLKHCGQKTCVDYGNLHQYFLICRIKKKCNIQSQNLLWIKRDIFWGDDRARLWIYLFLLTNSHVLLRMHQILENGHDINGIAKRVSMFFYLQLLRFLDMQWSTYSLGFESNCIHSLICWQICPLIYWFIDSLSYDQIFVFKTWCCYSQWTGIQNTQKPHTKTCFRYMAEALRRT